MMNSCIATQFGVVPQVLEYIKVEDFEGADAAVLQGPDGRARCEALRLTSHMLQANRSQEGTIVTVKDLINLPREVHTQRAWAHILVPVVFLQCCCSKRVISEHISGAWVGVGAVACAMIPLCMAECSWHVPVTHGCDAAERKGIV